MPFQRLSLFAPLSYGSLEAFVTAIQTLTSDTLLQFKLLTRVYHDDSTPQGRRPSDLIRIRTDTSSSDTTLVDPPILELIDTPEMNKRPVTSRTVHTVQCTSGDPPSLVKSMGYGLAFSYFEQGYRLKIGSLQIRVYQIFRAVLNDTAMRDDDGDAAMQDLVEQPNDDALDGVAIGDTETWIVQADIDLRTSQPDIIQRGVDELMTFKREVQGFINLEPVLDELR